MGGVLRPDEDLYMTARAETSLIATAVVAAILWKGWYVGKMVWHREQWVEAPA